MAPKYHWQGEEVPVCGTVFAHELTIDMFDQGIAEQTATGSFAFCDYTEHGIIGRDRWEAKRKPSGLIQLVERPNHGWSVRACQDEGGTPFFGEGNFTLSPTIDAGIHAFIGHHLNLFRRGEKPENPIPWDELIEPFTGDCCCQNGTIEDPVRIVGKFPDNCFVCSCGTRYYYLEHRENHDGEIWCQIDHSRWWPVPDDNAWAMLCQNNGMARRAIMPIQNWNGFTDGIYLFQTMCDEGLTLL